MSDSLAIRRRPLVPVAGLLISGIVSARFVPDSSAPALWLSGFAALLFVFRSSRIFALAAALVALGAVLYSARYRITSDHDLRLVLSGEPELVTVRGRMSHTPSLRDFYSGTNTIVSTHCIIKASEILRNKQWQKVTGYIATRTRGELTPDYFQGGTVEITGVIETPPRAAAPGLFDYRAYLHNLRIFYQLKSDSTNDWTLVSPGTMPLSEWFRRWGQRQLQRGLPSGDEQTEMIWAMTLGIKRALSGEGSEPFMRTGTMHIFAVSGLHVACLAVFFVFLLKAMGLSFEVAGLISIPLVWFYVLATGWESSAIRSWLMFTVITASRCLKRPADLLNSTAAAALIILLFQPEQLFQAGFQLSFVVVASLAIVIPGLGNMKPGVYGLLIDWLKPDPFLPRPLWPRWRQWAMPFVRFGKAMVVVSIASWIGSAPLTAYYFNIVTVSSFVANLLAVPLSSVALASTVFSLLLPFAAPVFNYFGWVFMWYTIQFTKLCSEIPYGYFYVPKPNAVFFFFYFAAVLFAFVPYFRSSGRRIFTLPLIALLGIAWAISTFIARPLATITVLPCAGTPALVREAHRDDLLIDCSSERDAEFVVERFLHAHGIGSVPNLLLTHGDAQTAGGFETIWNEFKPAVIYVSTARSRSPFYRRALRVLATQPERRRTVSLGDYVNGWEVLHPPEGRGHPRADDNAIVLRRKFGPWTVLHLSDLGEVGQTTLIRNHADLRADIVIAGMPEQDEPLANDLLGQINPKIVILGTTRYPYQSEGTPELRARLEATGAAVLYTTDSDAVTIRFDENNCAVSTMNGKSLELSRSLVGR